jgi:hypothetical protein
MENQNAKKELMNKIITRAWKDPQFKKQLFANPKAALKEMHYPLPENMQIRVVEEGQKYNKDDKNVLTIILPKQPEDAHKLSEKELANLAGGGWGSCSFSF